MTLKLAVCGSLVVLAASAVAQVASHAPTAVAPSAHTQGQSAPAQFKAGRPVVRVNGTALTDVDLLREEYAIFPYGKQHNGIPKDLEPQIRAGAMKMMVFEELVYQEALRRKLVIPPATMQKAEADFRKTFATPALYHEFLASEFQGSQQLLVNKIRRSILIEDLLKQEVTDKSVVTPAEVKAYYDQHLSRFQEPESYTFQTISILPPENAKGTPEELKTQKARAEQAVKLAKATHSADEFGLLAEKTSDDDYRVMMGQHKPVPVKELAPQVLQALKSLKPGGVSDLLQVDNIYTILRFEVHTPAGIKKFEEVKAAIQKEMQEKKKNDLQTALDAKLHQGAKIEQL